MTTISINILSQEKKIPETKLIEFGLSNIDEGVIFSYRLPTGEPGRSRLRSALRGADGTSWYGPQTCPITAYIAPQSINYKSISDVIIVEGESDCWTLWHHGYRSIGIPGSDNVKSLTKDHLANINTIYLQKERVTKNTSTYPKGVDFYINELSNHIKEIGFTGQIYSLIMPEGFQDLSDLYINDETRFLTKFNSALSEAKTIVTKP